MNAPHRLYRETIIDRPLDEVFAFFSDAYNLEALTPDFLNFKILTPHPIRMHEGTFIDYKIKLFGIPFKWKTRISLWEPGKRFIDEQITGPYALWVHEHTFEQVEGGTRMTDTVHYRSMKGFLDFLPHQLFVKQRVEQIFDYRTEALLKIFPPQNLDISVTTVPENRS